MSFPEIREALLKRKALDFFGLFFTIAIKEGGSQIIHIDWTDHPWVYAWIILAGEGWEGGELCLPQLGRKIPTSPGQVIAFTARTLAHFSAAHRNGRRVVFTGFTDYWIMSHAFSVTVI